MRIGQPVTGRPLFGEAGPPAMTAAAGFNFFAQSRRADAARRLGCSLVFDPGDTAPLVEVNEQTFVGVLVSGKWPPTTLRMRPGDVSGPLAVTGLAAHTELGQGGREPVGGRVVIFVHP